MADANNLSVTAAIVGLITSAWEAVQFIVAEPTELLIELRDGLRDPVNKQRTWARLTVRHNEADAYALGARYAVSGSLYVNISVPFKASAGHLAQRVALHLTDALKSYSGDDVVEFSRIRSNEIGHVGGYYCVNVLADFEYLQLN
jgi:hypothetical protein